MLKNYFKKLFLVVFLSVSIILPLSLKAEETPYFEFIIDSDISMSLHGVDYRELKGDFRTGTRIVKQVINYTAANLKEDNNLYVVSGDNYIQHGFGMGHIRGQTFVINQAFQHQAQVVSAVNGDFFVIRHDDSNRLGLTVGAHIKEYRTIHEGDKSRPLVGFHDDGSVTIGKPTYSGYEVIVLDSAGSRKQKEIKVAGFNRLPEEGEVTAFLWDHEDTISSPEAKMVFSGIDVKTVAGDVGRYFAEGTLNYITTEDVTLKRGEFLLMGDDIYTEGLITSEDTVIVHNVLTGIHEGIRSGVAGAQMLVENGVMVESDNLEVHPRTAVGVKADGTVFFVTIDGRRPLDGIPGMDYEQMSYLMLYLGAETAINLDGGGSTTMLFHNEETNYYDTKNTPSDNPHSLRSVANGLFLMYGNLEMPLPASPFPDTRAVLSNPSGFYFDQNKTLMFNNVENATSYTIKVDGKNKIVTSDPNYLFNLDYGTYLFEVQAFGDFDDYKQSSKQTYEATVFTSGLLSMIDGLKGYAKKANQK